MQQNILLEALTKLEANVYYSVWNKYVRITYLLFQNPEKCRYERAYIETTRYRKSEGDNHQICGAEGIIE